MDASYQQHLLPKEQELRVDWTECILCQRSSEEYLQCLSAAKLSYVSAGYKTFSDYLEQFNEINFLSNSINWNRLNDDTESRVH